MVFLAPPNNAEKAVRLCGTPTVTLAVETAGTNASIFTVIAYLYDVDPPKQATNGAVWGTLISHGPKSEWGDLPNYNRSSSSNSDSSVGGGSGGISAVVDNTVEIRFRSLCWDVRKGHGIGLGIDMFSEMYKPANAAQDLKMTITFDGASILKLPYV